MARPKKPNKAVNMRMDIGIHQQLERFCAATGDTKTSVIEEALSLYFSAAKRDKRKMPGNKTSGITE